MARPLYGYDLVRRSAFGVIYDAPSQLTFRKQNMQHYTWIERPNSLASCGPKYRSNLPSHLYPFIFQGPHLCGLTL